MSDKKNEEFQASLMVLDELISQQAHGSIHGSQAKELTGIMSIVENPFIRNKPIDSVSMIFQRFLDSTDIHPGLPIFCFLGLMSAWCVQNVATFKIPCAKKSTELDTWVLVLAKSGSSKSMALSSIVQAMPKDLVNGEPVVQPNFYRPISDASFVTQLKKLPNHRGFWQQDEGSQFLKQVDAIAGPLAGIKQSILITKDHGSLDYATKSEGEISINHPVLTVLMLNTIDSMRRAFSEESMHDGTFRRFTVAMVDDKTGLDGLSFEESAIYKLENLIDSEFEDELASVFTQNIENAEYSFDENCYEVYSKAFKQFWLNNYIGSMSKHQNYFRTYMMESWKYAVFHHLFHKKPGRLISQESLQWGIRVSVFLLDSLIRFIDDKVTPEKVSNEGIKLEKMKSFIKENENKESFNMRMFCRKFNLKKEDALTYLYSIKTHNKHFKSKLFDELQSK